MKSLVRLAFLTCLFLTPPASLRAQQSGSPCEDMKYEHHNMVDYGPLRISNLWGTTKDADGFTVPNACIGVFNESDHRTVATGQADSEGHFEIRNVPNGKYRLVVASDGFCAANAPVILRKRSRGKKKLVVTLKPSAVDVCSFMEWK